MKQMKYSKRMMAATALIASLGAGALGVSSVVAAPWEGDEARYSLVEAIAKRFSLDVADVQAVFDEQREKLQAEHEAREAEMLAQAVLAGKITQAQADAITVKRQEMQDSMASFATMDEDARRAAMKAQMDELKQWSVDNGVPMFFMPDGPGEKRHGHGGELRMKYRDGLPPLEDEDKFFMEPLPEPQTE